MSTANPYAAPLAGEAGLPSSAAIRRTPRGLEVPTGVPLPRVCVKCGSRDRVKPRAEKFTWTPQWIYFGLLVPGAGLLVVLVLALIFERRGVVQATACASCRTRWLVADVAWGVSLVATIVGVVAALATVSRSPLTALVLFLGGLALPFIVRLLLLPSWGLVVTHATKTTATLKGVADEALLRAAGERQDGRSKAA